MTPRLYTPRSYIQTQTHKQGNPGKGYQPLVLQIPSYTQKQMTIYEKSTK